MPVQSAVPADLTFSDSSLAAECPRARPEANGQTSLGAAVEPLLVDTAKAREICASISSASWHRLKAAGKTPAPVRLGGRVLYRVVDLRLWVALGCPDCKTFEAYKAANANGRSRQAGR
jgi:hypothetical protein